jgi:hypothetical protein
MDQRDRALSSAEDLRVGQMVANSGVDRQIHALDPPQTPITARSEDADPTIA